MTNKEDLSATEWQQNAACRNTDPDLFFPEGATGKLILLQIELAKAVCRQCVVKEKCLSYALSNNEKYGIWGGTSEEERRKILRSTRQQKTCDTA